MRNLVRSAVVVLVLSLVPVAGAVRPAAAQAPEGTVGFATFGDFVDWAYRRVLGRGVDPGGLAFWTDTVGRGGDSVVLLRDLVVSPENDAWAGQILRAYRVAYARAGDLEGFRYWLSLRGGAGGRSFRDTAYSAFVRSPEFEAAYGQVDDAEFVRRVYRNAFDRVPDPGGQSYWLGRLRSTSRAQVAFEIGESPEHRRRRLAEVRIHSAYVAFLGRFADPGAFAHWSRSVTTNAYEMVRAIRFSPELEGRLPTIPRLTVTTVVGGLRVPWGLAFAPDGTMLFTQRPGVLTVRLADGTVRDLQAPLGDVRAASEGGLLDLALDPGFAQNRRFYTCQSRRGPDGRPLDVAVVAWTVDPGWRAAARVADPLVGGIPTGSGRHNGCRILPDATTPGALLVATGDAAIGGVPQDLRSLGGKLLRISATTGEGVAGNPFASSSDPNTRRILEWGHRNVQGLARHPSNGALVTVEHGPTRDDEINRHVPGGDFGWAPPPGAYDESVPMTRAGGVPALWSSGFPTVAPSGATWLDGCSWGALDDHLAVARLAGQRLVVHGFGGGLLHLGVFDPLPAEQDHGRLRTAVVGPDGALYVTTSNGSDDRILRIAPSGGRCAAS